MKLFAWILRVAVAAVFIAAAIPKIVDPAAFVASIQTYRLIPDGAAVIFSVWLPWLELGAALAIFPRRQRSGASWLLLALTFVFLAALGQAWLRGLDITCGCFGSATTVTGSAYARYFLRDGLLIAAIAFLLWQERLAARSRVNS
jgi:putative oxidoreductase